MSFTPSHPEKLKAIFSGSRFIIPIYQRKYSWKFDQFSNLWEDIQENIDTQHFIGTLCFKKITDSEDIINEHYEVIDGQQRLTTIYILMSVLIDKLTDKNAVSSYKELFLGAKKQLKLQPQGEDLKFLQRLIFDYKSILEENLDTRSHKLMYQCKKSYSSLSKDFTTNKVSKWLNFISNQLEILIFNVADESQAVKMFTVINDRGLALSNLDKSKSILIYYSTLYLGGDLNSFIHKCFGVIFDSFDQLLQLRNELGVFTRQEDNDFENTFYTHHYYSSRRLFEEWDYELGATSIFNHLKRKCENLKGKQVDLEKFMNEYLLDFSSFAKAYSALFNKITVNERYQKFFQYMGFTATMYPLLVRLFEQKKLDKLFPILEVAEIRVYKLKNTNPRKAMYTLSSEITETDYTIEELYHQLAKFISDFLNDYQFDLLLRESIDNKAPMVKYVIYELNRIENNQEITLDKYRDLQVEHIFCKTPEFKGLKKYGFSNKEMYDVEITKLGNLSLLESKLNKLVDNFHPSDKIEGYQKSKFLNTHNLSGMLKTFAKKSINDRTDELTEIIKKRFSI